MYRLPVFLLVCVVGAYGQSLLQFNQVPHQTFTFRQVPVLQTGNGAFRSNIVNTLNNNLIRQRLVTAGIQPPTFLQTAPSLPVLPQLPPPTVQIQQHQQLPTLSVAPPTVVNPTVFTPTTVVDTTPTLRINVPEAEVIPVVDNTVDTIELTPPEADTSKEDNEAARSAHYSFDSSIQDTINDASHTRQETRNGLSLTGLYSYSDGFFKRTVHYAADENGYKVTKEEIQPIGDGPKVNPQGTAQVSTSLGGQYSITTNDIQKPTSSRLEVPLPTQQIFDARIST